MTTLVQNARYGDVLGSIFGALAAAVTVRGLADGTAAVALIGTAGLVAVAAGWARFRFRPRVELRVGDDQLCVGRGEVRLELHGGWRQGISLHAAGAHPTESIPLFGFETADVLNACTAHGWHLD